MQEPDSGTGNNNISPVFRQIFRLILFSKVEIAFSKFDTSGDEKVNYREFCEMINTREMQERNG